ncbi:hypothetical protein [Agaribacterium haliotis]|uniref:hypothetical protein n=1 Tax=Agaribacterium haliotis TaxID=2013869 RepID=UPI000BB5482D|nr:hypothetical protein [Agaribacterium haliotis]
MNKVRTISTFLILFAPLVSSASDDEAEHLLKIESTITGDKEQPAVSYFVPWQEVGTPDKLQWQMDEKYDDTLNKADRDIMLRSTRIYEQMNIEKPQSQN